MKNKKYMFVVLSIMLLCVVCFIVLENNKEQLCNRLEFFIPSLYNNPNEECKIKLITKLENSDVPIMQIYHRLSNEFYKFINGKTIETKSDKMIAEYFIKRAYRDFEIISIDKNSSIVKARKNDPSIL